MTVPPVTPATAASSSAANSSAATSATKSTTLGYSDFLKLLITEMKNQDPTNPMDATSQVSQLASFSAVEQQVQTNTTLTSVLNSSTLTQAEAAIGRTVTSSDGSISGTIASVSIASSGASATLADGRTVMLGSGVTIS